MVWRSLSCNSILITSEEFLLLTHPRVFFSVSGIMYLYVPVCLLDNTLLRRPNPSRLGSRYVLLLQGWFPVTDFRGVNVVFIIVVVILVVLKVYNLQTMVIRK